MCIDISKTKPNLHDMTKTPTHPYYSKMSSHKEYYRKSLSRTKYNPKYKQSTDRLPKSPLAVRVDLLAEYNTESKPTPTVDQNKSTVLNLLDSFEAHEIKSDSNRAEANLNQNSFSNVSRTYHMKSSSIERPIYNNSVEGSTYGKIRPIVKSSTQASINTKDMSSELKVPTENKLEEANKQIEYLKAQLFEQLKNKSTYVCSLCNAKERKVPTSTRFDCQKAEKECEEDLEFLKLEVEANNSTENQNSNNISNTTSSYTSSKP
jgi:hypothetical protein